MKVTISIEEETKALFDTIQAELSGLKGKIINQNDALLELIKTYNESKTQEA